MTSDTAAIVARYFSVVADLGSTESELRELLHPDAVFIEHPNPVRPQGGQSDVDDCVRGFLAGKSLLSDQSIDIHHFVVEGQSVAVQSTWTGVIGQNSGPFAPGTTLTAHMGGFLTIRDGLIARHETYDCYEPFPTGDS